MRLELGVPGAAGFESRRVGGKARRVLVQGRAGAGHPPLAGIEAAIMRVDLAAQARGVGADGADAQVDLVDARVDVACLPVHGAAPGAEAAGEQVERIGEGVIA